MGVGGQRHDPAALPPGVSVHNVQETGWALDTAWKCAENLALHRDSIHGPSIP
jgi:hypothetical protein